MARVTPEQLAYVSRVSGSAKEAQSRMREDAKRRATATNVILPQEVKGEYDAARLLLTTLGGDLRSITHNDLQAFRQNAKTVGSRLKKGIKAQQIINLSRQEDRERANKQIHMAVPVGTNKGTIRFVTNAGPDSDRQRHHVAVELVNYEAAIASPTEPKKMATLLVKDSPLKFECDCGRHAYWYRYIATIGGFNAGRAENGYPKLKNPNLTGVACKHVLRVMHELSSSLAIRSLIAKMVERGQSENGRKNLVVSREDARKIAQMQVKRKREILVKEPAKVAAKLKRTFAAKQVPPKHDAEQERFNVERNLRNLLRLGALSQGDFASIMKKVKR